MSRSTFPTANRQWLLGGAAVVVALGVGFGAAKLTTPKPPAEAAEPEAAEAAHGADTLTMGAERLTASGVQVQPVATSGLSAEIVAQATVEAEPTGQAVLTARAAGSVARIMKRLGDPVRAGETLALVESRDAGQIAADRSVAVGEGRPGPPGAGSRKAALRAEGQPSSGLRSCTSRTDAAEAEARRATSAAGAAAVSRDGRYVSVISPISGRITSMPVNLGAFVQPETELFRIADPSRVQIEAQVTAADARRIQPGDQAVIESSTGETRMAVVRAVTPGVSEETRSATVVLTLTGGAGQVQPGQLVRARITSRQSTTSGFVVSEDSVQVVEGRDAVFVRTHDRIPGAAGHGRPA